VLLAVSVGAKLQELVDNFFFAGLKFIFDFDNRTALYSMDEHVLDTNAGKQLS
jgi:hypothetical protein